MHQEKAEVAVLISDTARKLSDERGHYIMIEGSILQQDIINDF